MELNSMQLAILAMVIFAIANNACYLVYNHDHPWARCPLSWVYGQTSSVIACGGLIAYIAGSADTLYSAVPMLIAIFSFGIGCLTGSISGSSAYGRSQPALDA